jgi:hypothetical protein
LIPAPPGIVARYKHEEDGRTHHNELAVIAFDEDGGALVLGKDSLVPATSYRNFDGLSDGSEHAGYSMLIPAGGWRVEFTNRDGSRWSEPLVGWALKPSSYVTPLTADDTGYVSDFEHYRGAYRIYHPDSEPDPAERPAAGPRDSAS